METKFENLTIKEAREIAQMFSNLTGTVYNTPQEPKAHGAVGKKCIIRGYASGVHFGEVVSVAENGGRSRVELKNSRRIYRWFGAFTLSEIARNGIKNTSKVSIEVPQTFIDDAIEFIPTNETSAKIIEEIQPYEP